MEDPLLSASPRGRKPGNRTSGLKLVLPFVAVIVLIPVLFALLQATFLSNAEQEAIDGLHDLRSIGIALGVALLLARIVLHVVPPLVLRFPAQQHSLLEMDRSQRERRRIESCSHWFVQMRWLAVIAATTAIFLAVQVAELLPATLIIPLLVGVGALAAFNLVVALLLRQGSLPAGLLQLQVYTDLAILNVLLHFSGGIENPFYILAVFHVMIAGILLKRGQCYAVAAAAGALFSLLVFAEWSGILSHYTLNIVPHGEEELIHSAHKLYHVVSVAGIFWGVLLLTAYFVTRLAEQVRSDEQVLEKLASHALAEHRLLENSLRTTATGLRVLDSELEVRWTSDRWREWFDAASPDIALMDPARQTIVDGTVRTTEIDLADVSGDPSKSKNRNFRITTAALYDDHDGRISEVVQLAQDITQQKIEQTRMMRAGQLAAVGELASHIAHEVNNPITIMSAKGRLLLANYSDQLPEKVKTDLTKIIQLADRVGHIASGLLNYSRPSSGVRKLLDLRQPLQRALDLIKQQVGDGRIAIIVDLGAKLPLVRASANELEQVFLNLLLNAVDAMPRGGDLGVSAWREDAPDSGFGSWVCIDVKDTGAGVPAESKDRIFEPFYTTKEEGKGTGLGLSICQGLVNAHGGEISVDCLPRKGARFVVKLPAAAKESTGEEADNDGA